MLLIRLRALQEQLDLANLLLSAWLEHVGAKAARGGAEAQLHVAALDAHGAASRLARSACHCQLHAP